MADRENLEVGINAKVDGDAETRKLADAVSSVNDALADIISTAKAASTATDRVERSLSGAQKSARAASSGMADLAKGLDKNAEASRAATDYTRAHSNALAAEYALTSKGASEYARAASARLKDAAAAREQAKASAAVRGASGASTTLSTAASKNSNPVAARTGAAAQASTQSAQQLAELNTYYRSLEKSSAAAAKQVDDANKRFQQGFASTRYALYDVSNSFAAAAVGLGAFTAGVVSAASTYQSAMASISRTSGVSGEALGQLQNDFGELAQTIPVAFDQLSEIGTLAGQLNIPASQIADFTKVTAQFASSTDVTVEAAATAFGRLDVLLPDVQGNYEALGSSILTVGVNSVATESQIISTTSQIAAAGAQAGFTSSQVIGLAASFASLGVAPEAARGTTLRVLGEINSAISEGGANLDKFGSIIGKTGAQFAEAFKSDAGSTFVELLGGLQKVAENGGNAEQTLNDLGITATRDISALLKLSQNTQQVADNFGYANTGFEQATQLGDAFAITSETLASKFQTLKNSIQLLFAELGEGALGPISGLVDGLQGVVEFLTKIAQNPIAKVFVGLTGGLVAVAALVAVLGAVFARIGAGALAIRQVRAELAGFEAQARSATTAGSNFAASLAGAGRAALGLKAALTSTIIGAALVVAFTAITAATEAFSDAQKTAADRAKEYYGDLSELSKALDADTEAAKTGGAVYGHVSGEITTARTAAADWTTEVERATGGQITLSDATSKTTETVRDQTLAIGDNAKAVLANMLANDEQIQKLVKLSQGTDFNTKGFLTALAEGDTKSAQAIYDQFTEKLNKQYANRTAKGATFETVISAADLAVFNQGAEALDHISGSLEAAATKSETFNAVAQATGLTVDAASGALTDGADATDELGVAAQSTSQRMSELRDAISQAFSQTDAIGGFLTDFYTLEASVAAGGNSFDAFSTAGITNLQNLQTAIASSITAGQALGLNAAESVAVLFNQLKAQGIDTAKLLAQLAGTSIPGLDQTQLQAYVNGTQQLTAGGQALSSTLSGINTQAQNAQKSLNKTGNSAAKAAPKIRTLVDYGNDLQSVFSRSFDLRFGSQNALDDITSAWQDIADKNAEAVKQAADYSRTIDQTRADIQGLQADIASLTADKAIQEYFLKVAENYGDSLRAGSIRADIGQIDADIAKARTDLAAKTDDLTGTQADLNALTADSTAKQIEQRASLGSLVQQYQAYVVQLASSGLSQAELATRTAQLKQEFINQATQLGFTRGAVLNAAGAFDDMTYAISRVPRNITVAADTNPAVQAMNELRARLDQASAAASGLRGNLATGFSVPPIDTAALAKAARAQGLYAQIAAIQSSQGYRAALASGADNVVARYVAQISDIQARLNSGNYASGGYTGNGGKYEEAGVVHKGEFVFDKESTSRIGVNNLMAMMNNRALPSAAPTVNVTAGSGGGGGTVRLDAASIAAIQSLGTPVIVMNGRVVGQVLSGENLNQASLGRNG